MAEQPQEQPQYDDQPYDEQAQYAEQAYDEAPQDEQWQQPAGMLKSANHVGELAYANVAHGVFYSDQPEPEYDQQPQEYEQEVVDADQQYVAEQYEQEVADQVEQQPEEYEQQPEDDVQQEMTEEDDQQDAEDDDQDEPEQDDADDAKAGNTIKRNNYTFDQKLEMAKPIVQDYYNQIKDYFVELGFKLNDTKAGKTFTYKNTKFAMITIAGKTGLKIYYKLSPADFEGSTLPFKDVSDKKKYEKTPLLFSVKSALAVRRAMALMDEIKSSF